MGNLVMSRTEALVRLYGIDKKLRNRLAVRAMIEVLYDKEKRYGNGKVTLRDVMNSADLAEPYDLDIIRDLVTLQAIKLADKDDNEVTIEALADDKIIVTMRTVGYWLKENLLDQVRKIEAERERISRELKAMSEEAKQEVWGTW